MKFSETHEWIRVQDGDIGVIGITHHAQKELGDIVYVELPDVGEFVNAGQEAAVLESTKSASDVYSPISGMIVEVNEELTNSPDLVNQSAEDKGWIFKVSFANKSELNTLMDHSAYQAMLKSS